MKLNEIVRKGFHCRYEPDDDYPGKKYAKQAAANENWNFYYNAPTLIVASNVSGYAHAMADCARSEICAAIHETAQGLHRLGFVTKR